jgi:hypothetical protein
MHPRWWARLSYRSPFFQTLAILLRSKSEEARPDGVVAIAAHRVADLASALISRFIVFISQKTWGKR